MSKLSLLALGLLFPCLPLAAQSGGDSGALRLAHQYAAFADGKGDFRDRLCQDLARTLAPAGLKLEVFPENKLIRNGDEMAALAEGRVELAVLPAYNAVKAVPELEVTLLPGLIESYAQAGKWKEDRIGQELAKALDRQGVRILAWVWQGAAMISAARPLQDPNTLTGVRIRGVSPSMDETMRSVRAEVLPLSASELGKAFAENKIDAAAATSSTLIAFRLDRYARALTTSGERSLFYFFIPLVISNKAWARLTPEAQKLLREAGQRFEGEAQKGVQSDDEALAKNFLAADAVVGPLQEEHWERWRTLSKASAWRKFTERFARGQELLDLAGKVR